MRLSLLVEPCSDLARTSHPGTERPYRHKPCMPDAEHRAHRLAPDGTCRPVRSPALMRHGADGPAHGQGRPMGHGRPAVRAAGRRAADAPGDYQVPTFGICGAGSPRDMNSG